MTIGEKIKKIRTEKLMTQSELVGDGITRNMLSRIENGAANPSLDTVRYIAARLNVSPGYLLAENEDEQIYLKYREINGIKRAFMAEDYRICRDMCMNTEITSDDEIGLLLAECDLLIAIDEFQHGNLQIACQYFDEALEACEKTVYRTDAIIAITAVYFRYMRRLSAALTSNIIDENEANVFPALTEDFCRYEIILEALDRGEMPHPVILDELKKKEGPYILHLEAMDAMKNSDYSLAYEDLHAILLGDFPVPEPMLYFVFCDLEVCCRELQNFKKAYEYSIDKLELLQKLLT